MASIDPSGARLVRRAAESLSPGEDSVRITGVGLMQALRVRGPFRGPSGYDHHVREFVREFARQRIAVQLVDLPEWGPAKLPAHMRDPWFERLSAPVDAGITLHFTMPHQVVSDGQTLDVNYTMFEATRIPQHWIDHNQQHDLVVVPTESSRAAWVRSGLPEERLRVSPLGVDVGLYGAPAEPLPLRLDTGELASDRRVRFLNVSDLGPRKNLLGLLHAWLLATSASDDAVLVIKLGRYAPGWFELLRSQIAELEREVGRSFADAAPVHFLFDLLADAEMPRLYASATHYISLSHGEGWDQPMVEAAATGLRLIAPDHSAYRHYLTPERATMLPSREIPARFSGDPALQRLFKGANWWEPDLDAAVAAIRAAIDGRDPGCSAARDYVLANLGWEQATRQLVAILDELQVTAWR